MPFVPHLYLYNDGKLVSFSKMHVYWVVRTVLNHMDPGLGPFNSHTPTIVFMGKLPMPLICSREEDWLRW